LTECYTVRNAVRMTDSGSLIRTHRTRLSPPLSLGDLAARTGITKASLSRIETGKQALTLPTGRKISVALGIPLDRLMPEVAAMFAGATRRKRAAR
jgi:transcriptional regulator with XRE-family HTH domain